MKIKDDIFFCFAHLRWCGNKWASSILIGVGTGYACIHHSKYWMPIHYDTIEDGQNKTKIIFYSLNVRGGLTFFFCFWSGNVQCFAKFEFYIQRLTPILEMWIDSALHGCEKHKSCRICTLHGLRISQKCVSVVY